MNAEGAETLEVERGEILVAGFKPDVKYLETQLESIKSQTLTEWTCRLGIDGYDPDAEALLKRLTEGDNRFVIHHYTDNLGFYRNFERLIAQADKTCRWIALSDQDDAWDPEKLEVLTSTLGTPNVNLVCCQARIVDGDGVVIGRSDRREVGILSLLLDNQVTGSFTVLDPKVAVAALPFPAPTAAAYHDHWLAVTALTMGEYRIVDRVLQSYVQHGANVLGEETGFRLRPRISRLLNAGIRGALQSLTHERWGWRQRMAAELFTRLPQRANLHPAPIHDVARNHRSLRLIIAIVACARRREVPAARAAGLLTGLLLSRPVAKSP